MGVICIAYDSGLFENINSYTVLDFLTSFGLSFMGGTATVGIKTALTSSYKSFVKDEVNKRGYKVVLEEGIIGREGIHSLSKNLLKVSTLNLIR